MAKFNPETGEQKKSKPNAPSYTSVFGKALLAEAEADSRVVGITAAMPSGTGINILADAMPKRVFDVGIAEQHAVTFAAGLAATGIKPFCAIYSSFLQRGYDQVVHDVALQNLPVRFAIDRAGLVGADGPTHAGAFDVAYLANLPNMVVMAAADEADSHMCTQPPRMMGQLRPLSARRRGGITCQIRPKCLRSARAGQKEGEDVVFCRSCAPSECHLADSSKSAA